MLRENWFVCCDEANNRGRAFKISWGNFFAETPRRVWAWNCHKREGRRKGVSSIVTSTKRDRLSLRCSVGLASRPTAISVVKILTRCFFFNKIMTFFLTLLTALQVVTLVCLFLMKQPVYFYGFESKKVFNRKGQIPFWFLEKRENFRRPTSGNQNALQKYFM